MSELERLQADIARQAELKAVADAKKAHVDAVRARKIAEWEAKYAAAGPIRRALMDADREWKLDGPETY